MAEKRRFSGAAIKEIRKRRGFNAEKLAALVGVSVSTIYRYENGDISNMGADKLKPIADALGVTPGELIGWDDSPAPVSLIAETVAPDEQELLSLFRGFNASARADVLRFVRAMAGNPSMQKDDTTSRMA